MNTSSGERNPVEFLAEEFLDRKRRGEHPTLREYVERHPELADEIRDLFPALLMIEGLGEGPGATTGSLASNGVAVEARLQRLGDYRILREIGRGGMGVVYEAEQESLGRRVALKVLSAGALADPKQVRRFEREAKAAARLHHTNIVPVFGVGCQDGHHYFVMQFIAGLGLDVVLDDLRRLRGAKSESGPAVAPAASSRISGLSAAEVARSLIIGRFEADGSPGDDSATALCDDPAPKASANGPEAGPPSSAVLPGSSELSASSDPDRPYYRSIARVGIQVAEAMEYANRQGILHRDVKPSNLLLDNHGNVWVADFGLAKTAEADDLTHTGDILGTIRYMAPERFAGHCDARSDVYSLGLSLYELIALRPAFEASDRHTLMERVLHEDPERLRKLAPSVPRDLETIIAKAMARDPALRYATAGALAEDLRRFVEDRPIRARRISMTERTWRWCRRNKVVAILMGVAASTLVGVAVLAVLYASQQRHLAAARQLYAEEQTYRADEQAVATRKIMRMADDLKSSLAESNRRLAMLNFERERVAFERGQIGVGMLWTVEALRMADRAGDPVWKRAALANLSAWRRPLVELKGVFHHSDQVRAVAFSPDGKTILTGSDKTARRWDAGTGQLIGPPLEPFHPGRSVAISPDGRFLLVSGGASSSSRLWDAPAPLPDDLPRLAAWVEAATGLELDERGSIRALDGNAWLGRRQRLESLGGPPPPDTAPRLDPILFGPAPTARGDAWKERGLWERAEAAYAEAARARPLIESIWTALVSPHAERGRFDRAAATIASAVRLSPDDLWLRGEWGAAALASGDRAGWRASCAALLDRFSGTIDPLTANSVAWDCSKGPDAAVDPGVPVRLAELAVRGASTKYKPSFVNTLGAALYRAGRYDEAIRRLEEGIRLRGGESLPQDWEFLSMAHHRLGHHAEARRWLDRLRDHQPSTDPIRFWNEVEIRLLRSEAEAVVLYDPVFPDDPFAH